MRVPWARSDNICGRAQGIAAGLQAWERYEALLAGKDIKKSDPEDPKVRTTFEDFMGAATLTSTGHTVRARVYAWTPVGQGMQQLLDAGMRQLWLQHRVRRIVLLMSTS